MTNIAKGGSRDKREMKFRNRAMPSRILYSTFYKYRKEQKQKQINPFVFFARKTKIYDIEKKQDSPAGYSRLSTPQSNLFRSVSPKLWL